MMIELLIISHTTVRGTYNEATKNLKSWLFRKKSGAPAAWSNNKG